VKTELRMPRAPRAGDRCTVDEEREGTILAFGPECCLIRYDEETDDGGEVGPYGAIDTRAEPDIRDRVVETSRVVYRVPINEGATEVASAWRSELTKLRLFLEIVQSRLDKGREAPLQHLDAIDTLIKLLPQIVALVGLVAGAAPDPAVEAKLREVVAEVERLARAAGVVT
jgi:hypothetical protein